MAGQVEYISFVNSLIECQYKLRLTDAAVILMFSVRFLVSSCVLQVVSTFI